MEATHECCECGRVGEWRWACTIWKEWGACGGDCKPFDLDEFAF